jgi:hypothetical protein
VAGVGNSVVDMAGLLAASLLFGNSNTHSDSLPHGSQLTIKKVLLTFTCMSWCAEVCAAPPAHVFPHTDPAPDHCAAANIAEGFIHPQDLVSDPLASV